MAQDRRKSLASKLASRLRQAAVEAFTHRIWTFPPELRELQQIDLALQWINNHWSETDGDTEQVDGSPVFLLSAGWRSGSTLLQRLLCSSEELVMWGEPLGDCAIIPRLCETLKVHARGWPPADYFSDGMDISDFSGSWIANVTPSLRELRAAHRAFMERWLGVPAREQFGVRRWGLKEVRLTVEHARYLKWLYPGARFVFCYRRLDDAYLSWRGNTWASAWPGYYSWSPIAYARHWKLLLSGFLRGQEELDAMLIRYEDLVRGNVDLDALANHVGLSSIDEKVLQKRIASPEDRKRRRRKHLTAIEKAMLRAVAGDVMEKVGYD